MSVTDTAEARLYKSTLKSEDTEEFIDLILFRPLGFKFALAAKRLSLTPNIITVLGIIIGATGGHLFLYQDMVLNIAGILLITLSSILDSTDGQLARLTNSSTRLGRLLDGLGGVVIFLSIYIHLCLRHVYGGGEIWIFAVCLIAGAFHSFQSAVADYYRNAHLYFVEGSKRSEFDNSEKLTTDIKSNINNDNFIKKLFSVFYRNYTREQELLTKNLQQLVVNVRQKFGGTIPEEIRNDFRAFSRPLQKYCNMLTLNTRFFAVYISLFFNTIWIFILYEVVVLNVVLIWLIAKHESNSKRLNNKVQELAVQ